MNAKQASALRLVIADDEALIRMELRSTLESAGYAVVGEASDGTGALKLARHLRPDAVLLDVRMPGMDGIEVAATLHQEKIAPALLVTGFSQPELVRRAAQAGIYSYLVKPFEAARLVAAIQVARSQWETLLATDQRYAQVAEKAATREVVDCAKRVLMETCGVNETRAYRMLQTRSMQTRRTMRAVAEAILQTQDVLSDLLADHLQSENRRERCFEPASDARPAAAPHG